MIDPKTELEALKGSRSWRQFGEHLGMEHSYLWQVFKGNKPFSDRLLEKLGLRIVYERISAEPARNAGTNRKRPANGANRG
jgi:hypothetical protein